MLFIDAASILSVTQVSRYLKELLDTDEILQDVWVRGEISDCKTAKRTPPVIAISNSKMPKHNCPASSSKMPVCVHRRQNCVMVWQLLRMVASRCTNAMVKCNCMLKM